MNMHHIFHSSLNLAPVLSDTYGDCFTGDLDDAFPDNRKPYVDDYEYDSDSDLEDDDEDGGSLEESSLAPAGSGQSSEFGGSDGSTLLNQTETKLSVRCLFFRPRTVSRH